MPLRNGKMTRPERAFAANYASTGDKRYSAAAAGYSSPQQRSDELVQKPAILAEVARIQQEKLFNELLPLAVKVHADILGDPKAPAGARIQAVKLAYDRTLGSQEGAQAKEPHEMTSEEIATAIAELERVAFSRAKPLEGAQEVRNDASIFE